MQAYGQYQEQKAANKAAEYNAQVNERNAQITEMQAKDAEKRGEIDARKKAMQVSQIIGSQRAAGAGGGLLVDAGSNLDLTNDSASFGALDALTLRNNASKEAWGYRNQGMNYQAEANLQRSSKRSPWMQTVPTLLNGASSMAMMGAKAGFGGGGTKTYQ